jgi:alkanesulfonate monooxygenase SsuD/methylene tetrahydromethanopterin reductase-like flavin-dependent oxidoreductase (luciferase family)
MLDALYPGRFDLGLGRSGQRRSEALKEIADAAVHSPRRDLQFSETIDNGGGPRGVENAVGNAIGRGAKAPEPAAERVVDGLLIPAPFSFAPILASKRSALFAQLLQQPGAEPADFADILDDIQQLLAGPVTDGDGNEARAVPGEGADLEIWILGSSGGQSARVAGERGLPFAANYHVAPAKVLEAVEGYRAAFRPSKELAEPKVMVSADVVVADDEATAHRLAAPYPLWVRSIRTGAGAIPFPGPAEAAAYAWSDADRKLVADRVATQFVGTPAGVADRLRTLQRVTGADELLVTTMTFDHTDRVRSFELLAKQWGRP